MPENKHTEKLDDVKSISRNSDSGRPSPGVSREQRISDEGLMRLEKQLQSGINISTMVLHQWVKRYGDEARDLIIEYRGKHDILSD